jgi:hypothetical protein
MAKYRFDPNQVAQDMVR